MASLSLSKPQYIFLNELNTKFRAYIGGFGSGKTYVGCLDLLLFAIEHPGISQGYFGPSYGSIKDIFWPTIEEAAETLNLRTLVKRADKELLIFSGGVQIGHIICRSMDRPESIVGFKVARALVDEIDTLPIDKARTAWRKIIARLRLVVDGVVNSIGVTCTPEGFLFVYEQFKKKPTESYSMVQASTYENIENLPEDYISSLYETYPEQLVQAYLFGEFVNLTSGSVYPSFDRKLNNTHYIAKPREPLHIGMDFNIYKMCAIIHVIRDGIPYAVDELTGIQDTPAIVDAINEHYPDHKIIIYPDASGGNKSSKGASISDLNILREAGFYVYARNKNPPVRDRVLSMNTMFCNANGDRKYFVNIDNCPVYAESLEQQVYDKNGDPDKSNDLDHPVDAGGYFIHYKWPVRSNITRAVTARNIAYEFDHSV